MLVWFAVYTPEIRPRHTSTSEMTYCIESHGLRFRRVNDARSPLTSQLRLIVEVPPRYRNGFTLSDINDTNRKIGASVTCKGTTILGQLMNLPRRAYQLFRAEGAGAIIRDGKKVLGYFDPFYQRVKPAYKSYSVGLSSAEFDMSRRRLGQYDFVDDLRSERELIQRILSIVEPDDVFYDIGANVGIYSCLVGNQINSGGVVAFEPTPEAFSMLEQNVQHNGIDAELFNIALSNITGTTKMSVRGQTGHQFSNEDTGTIEVKTQPSRRTYQETQPTTARYL